MALGDERHADHQNQHVLGIREYQVRSDSVKVSVSKDFDWIQARTDLYVTFECGDEQDSVLVSEVVKETSSRAFVIGFPDHFKFQRLTDVKLIFFRKLHQGENGASILTIR